MTHVNPFLMRLALGTILITAISVPTEIASAQTPQLDALNSIGFQRARSYFSPEPWEHYDTVTGNVMLTFTDLVLPGNAGRQLAFQRTYNNAVPTGTSPASRWTFGIAGVPMQVIEQAVPDNFNVNTNDVSELMSTTPKLVMADGSKVSTLYIARPLSVAAARTAEVISPGFFKYNRAGHYLLLPDGTICYYDQASGRLLSYIDPFQNAVYLTWSAESLVVTQDLRNDQVRAITLTLDSATRVRALDFDGKHWQYDYDHEMNTIVDITAVTLPNQSHWTFTYDNKDLIGVTTPLGGQVSYEYTDYDIYPNPNDPSYVVHQHTLQFRRSDGRDVVHGDWQIQWGTDGVQPFAWGARIITPSQITVEYRHGVQGDSGHAMGGNFGVLERIIYSGTQELEHEQTTYQSVPVVAYSGTVWWGTVEPSVHALARDGRIYTTQFIYSGLYFGNYHHPSQVIETGDITRTTTRSYTHNTTTWILGRVTTQDVTVGSETFRQEFSWDMTTGFLSWTNLPYLVNSQIAHRIETHVADAFGNVFKTYQRFGLPTYFAYDWGRVSVIQTPEHTTYRTINVDGTLASETMAGRTTTYEYDALFRPTVIQPPGGTHPIINTYDDATGTIRRQRGTSDVSTEVDGFGRVIATTDSTGVNHTTVYDAEGRVHQHGYPFRVGDPYILTTFSYDGLDRLTTTLNPDGTYRQNTYGGGVVTTRDENGHETDRHFAAFGHPDDARLVSLTDADEKTWTYQYNALGQLTRTTAPGGLLRTWQYNGNTQLAQETNPESGVVTYTYDTFQVHRLAQKTDAKGVTFAYGYDGNDRIVSITGGTTAKYFTYEFGSDNRQSASTGPIQSVFMYDQAGRLSGRDDVVANVPYRTRFEYDVDDDLRAISYATPGEERRRISYDYDSEHHVAKVYEVSAGRDYAFAFNYHPSGAIRNFTSGNLLPTTIGYDANRYWVSSINSGPVQLTYGFDFGGNVVQIGDARPGMDQTFVYDALDRLAAAIGPYGSLTYPYDAHGNRQTAPGGQVLQYDPGTLRLMQQGTETYTYDANGNLGTAPNRVYSYNPFNMLVTATVFGAQTQYAYDADDLRFSKISPDGSTLYFRGLNDELLTEWRNPGPNGEIRDYVYAGTRPIAVVKRPESPGAGTCGPLGFLGSASVPSGGVGQVTFCGVQGQTVSAVITLTSGASFGGTWTVCVKRTTNNAIVGSCASAQTGTVIFLDTVTLPANETYKVEIDPVGTLSGTVTVTVNNVQNVTGPIVAGGPPVTVAIGTPGQNGRLTFTASAGQSVSAAMRLTSGASYSGTWSLLIKAANGTTLRSASMPNGTLIFADAVMLSAGEYTVEVDPVGMALGTVAVTLYGMTHVSGPISTDGTPVTVPLTVPGQNGVLTFTGITNQRISATLTSVTAFAAQWSLVIKRSNGVTVASANASSGTVVFKDTFSLPANDTYTLTIDPSDVQVGIVDARVFTIVDATGGVAINGAALPVSVTAPGQNAVIAFDSSQSQAVRVRLTGNTFGLTTVYLKRPDGSQMTFATSSLANFDLSSQTLNTTGTYTILVDPIGSATGTINVAVTSP